MDSFWAQIKRLPKPAQAALLPLLMPIAMWRLQLLVLATASIGTMIAIALKLSEWLPIPWKVIFLYFIFSTAMLSVGAAISILAWLSTEGIMFILHKCGYKDAS